VSKHRLRCKWGRNPVVVITGDVPSRAAWHTSACHITGLPFHITKVRKTDPPPTVRDTKGQLAAASVDVRRRTNDSGGLDMWERVHSAVS